MAIKHGERFFVNCEVKNSAWGRHCLVLEDILKRRGTWSKFLPWDIALTWPSDTRVTARGSDLKLQKPWTCMQSPTGDINWKVSMFTLAPAALEDRLLFKQFFIYRICFLWALISVSCNFPLLKWSESQIKCLYWFSKSSGFLNSELSELPPHSGADSWCYQKGLGLTCWFNSSFCLSSLCGLGWNTHLPKPQFSPLSYEENGIGNI